MVSEIDGLDGFADGARVLEETLGSVTALTDAFETQLRNTQSALSDTTRDLGNLERGFSGGLKKAFDGLVLNGNSLSQSLATVAEAMSRTVYNNAIAPVTDHFGSLLANGVNSLVSGLMPFAQGGAFSDGRVMPFARGGVVSQPTGFAMRGGSGLMGEAGPEAIIPLARGADGRLGVRSQGGGSVNVTMNINTPDVAGFQRSQSQIAAQMTRMMSRGQRNR